MRGLIIFALVAWIPQGSFAHPGGLAANGCHNDRKRGGSTVTAGDRPRPLQAALGRMDLARPVAERLSETVAPLVQLAQLP